LSYTRWWEGWDADWAAQVQGQNEGFMHWQEGQIKFVLDFVASCPNLFPKELSSRTFLESWFKEVMEMSSYHWERNAYCVVDPAFLVFGHPNLCSDNAWFWHDDEDKLNCGILDWGAAMHQSIASMLGTCLGQADYEMLTEHEGDLIRGFADSLLECGAPEVIAFDTLYTMVKLQQAVISGHMVVQLFKMEKPAVWAKYKDRWVPEVYDRFLPRNYVGSYVNSMANFKYRGVYSTFQEWLAKNKHWFPPKKPFVCPAFPL